MPRGQLRASPEKRRSGMRQRSTWQRFRGLGSQRRANLLIRASPPTRGWLRRSELEIAIGRASSCGDRSRSWQPRLRAARGTGGPKECDLPGGKKSLLSTLRSAYCAHALLSSARDGARVFPEDTTRKPTDTQRASCFEPPCRKGHRIRPTCSARQAREALHAASRSPCAAFTTSRPRGPRACEAFRCPSRSALAVPHTAPSCASSPWSRDW